MIPRLIFAALVFGSLASRPDAAPSHRRGAPEGRLAQARPTVGPAPSPGACP
jgi:hypothetical protein